MTCKGHNLVRLFLVVACCLHCPFAEGWHSCMFLVQLAVLFMFVASACTLHAFFALGMCCLYLACFVRMWPALCTSPASLVLACSICIWPDLFVFGLICLYLVYFCLYLSCFVGTWPTEVHSRPTEVHSRPTKVHSRPTEVRKSTVGLHSFLLFAQFVMRSQGVDGS